MKLPLFCIERPVVATVMSLILMLAGIMGYSHLSTRFFPEFETHTVTISTHYPGASASVIETTITTPLEKSVSGIEGIQHLTSISSQNVSSITAELAPEVNVSDVTNKIRNQIAMGASSLPNTIQPPLVQIGHGEMDLIDIAFSIQGNQLNKLRDYLERNVIDPIEQLPGISEVQVTGANKYAMRITLNPAAMTAQHISVSDIEQAIQKNNLQLPVGTIHSATMNFPLTATTNLHTATEFENIAITTQNHTVIHLKDIARVELGESFDEKSIARVNGKPAILLSVYNADNANPITSSLHVRAFLSALNQQLPADIEDVITFDQAVYMNSSIHEVYKSMALAIIFVAVIIFLFLGKIRSSLIPIVTIPICILSTMGFMYFAGLSINMITLLAIVLSIGLVVDDAIVVLENIHRHIEQGMTRRDAAIQGISEITMPVIAMTLTLVAVYAPIALMHGEVAQLFASFAVTLSIAVIVSGFVALTLSPMMCSKFLPQTTSDIQKSTVMATIEHFFSRLTNVYRAFIKKLLAHRWIVMLATFIFIIVGIFFSYGLSKVFLPREDMGFLITLLQSNTGTNDQFSESQIQQLDNMISKNAAVQTNVSLSFDSTTNGDGNIIFTTLKDYDIRHVSASVVADQINAATQKMTGLHAVTFAPAFGGSTRSMLSFYIMAPEDYHALYNAGQALKTALNNYPGLSNLHSNIAFDNQQYTVNVNRSLADALQVDVSAIDHTLAAMLGGETVTNFDWNGETYDVTIRAEPSYSEGVKAIEQLAVPNNTGQFVPLSNLVSVTLTPMQTELYHYNRLRAAVMKADVSPGYSLGAVVSRLQKKLPEILPANVKYAFRGEAEQIISSSNSMLTIFILAFIFIYLVLSAQFESFLDPLIILLAAPLSVLGALVSLRILGGSINLYTVIGLVTLVGLIAKHGILITQFANTLQREGKSAVDAVIEAASIRLRPVLMTTVAMVFGTLPLLFATGASAQSRMEVGTVLVGGLLFGTFFSLVLVPIAYSLRYHKNTLQPAPNLD